MQIKYDSKIDALYINLSAGKYEQTKKITDSIMVDISSHGKVLGIEILDASVNIEKFRPSDYKLAVHL